MVKDAEMHKEEDLRRKELIEIKNTADALVHQTEKSLNELKDTLSEDDKTNINNALEDLKATLKNDNATKEEIESKIKALNDVSHKLAEAMYTKNDKGSETQSNNKKDDDVIDAEVE